MPKAKWRLRAAICAAWSKRPGQGILGWNIWLGWVMVAALVYSGVPPVILRRTKKPLANAEMEKILYMDPLQRRMAEKGYRFDTEYGSKMVMP